MRDLRMQRHADAAGHLLNVVLEDPRHFERTWLPRNDADARSVALLAIERIMDERSARLELILDALCTRRLHWEPADACLALDVALADPSYEPLRAAVRIAAATLDRHPSDSAVVERLRTVDTLLHDDRLHASGFFRGKLQPLVERLIAAGAPGGLVDLTAIELGDAFGGPARYLVTELAEGWDGAAPAITHLGRPRGGVAPARWRAHTIDLVGDRRFVELLRTLLELAAATEPTPGDATVHGFDVSDRFLFRPGNGLLVRAAVWATRDVEEEWVVPVLTTLCRRAADEVPGWDGPTACSPKVAYACADELVERHARAEVESLLHQVWRPEVVRRLAPGQPDVVAERLRAIARERRAR